MGIKMKTKKNTKQCVVFSMSRRLNDNNVLYSKSEAPLPPIVGGGLILWGGGGLGDWRSLGKVNSLDPTGLPTSTLSSQD